MNRRRFLLTTLASAVAAPRTAESQQAGKDGLVASLARPGGNITGMSILAREVSGKRLALLKETVPRLARVAVLWNGADPGKAAELPQGMRPSSGSRSSLNWRGRIRSLSDRKGERTMTYGFCPEDWPLFHSQIEKRRIQLADIERVEMRPDSLQSSVAITVILRSGRVETWTQHQSDVGALHEHP